MSTKRHVYNGYSFTVSPQVWKANVYGDRGEHIDVLYGNGTPELAEGYAKLMIDHYRRVNKPTQHTPRPLRPEDV